MKRLYIMRGCPGSGKSTLIKDCGLIEFSISTDAIRLEYNGTEVIDGKEMISQKNNKFIFSLVYQRLEERMQSGLPVILDATNISGLGSYYKLASDYGYEVIIVDFKVSLEVLKDRNKGRGIHYVPEEVIERMYEKKKKSQIMQKDVRIIRPSDFYKDWQLGVKK